MKNLVEVIREVKAMRAQVQALMALIEALTKEIDQLKATQNEKRPYRRRAAQAD